VFLGTWRRYTVVWGGCGAAERRPDGEAERRLSRARGRRRWGSPADATTGSRVRGRGGSLLVGRRRCLGVRAQGRGSPGISDGRCATGKEERGRKTGRCRWGRPVREREERRGRPCRAEGQERSWAGLGERVWAGPFFSLPFPISFLHSNIQTIPLEFKINLNSNPHK
jgi:hypothetical protein